MLTKAKLGYVCIIVGGLALALGVKIESGRGYAQAREHYLSTAHAESRDVALGVEETFRSIYENVRTLTLLPSVRNIDRHGANLTADGRDTIQQVYNNLASSVDVSEIYIVPVDFNPEAIDPVTGEPEVPILMFDQLVINSGVLAKEKNPFSTPHQATLSDEEVEIWEYRQLHTQLAWLKQHYPDQSLVQGLRVPMIANHEVMTCDNREFIHTGDDADRAGLMFSIPIFGPDNKLKGTVTAIILSNALRKILPAEDFALVNSDYHYLSKLSAGGQERASAHWALQAKPDPELIYSEVIPLNLHDPRSQWALWVGRSNSSFVNGTEVRAVRTFELASYVGLALLTSLAWGLWALSLMFDRREAQKTAEISHMANHDGLTGLPNRKMLSEKLRSVLGHELRGEMLSVLYLDLDRFKSVNDMLGHVVGDALLKALAARLRSLVREGDTVGRLGGDEFAIIQPNLEEPAQASALARRIIDVVAEPFELEGRRIIVGTSIGIAVAPNDGDEPEELLKNADLALCRAKSDGRGVYRFFEPEMDARMQERRQLEFDLRTALANDEFVLFYQAVVNAETEEIIGFEALLRWNHPRRGMVGPLEFIPIAEETGLIVPIGEWVLRQACADAVMWPNHLKVAVNLSPLQFTHPTLPHKVALALRDSGLLASRLELEITESVLLADNELTVSMLHQLHTLGVGIVMDDFGTGYSSLSYLRSFPFDKIKIDRSFVGGLPGDADCLAIIRAVAGLGTSLGMATTAEGVETAEQLTKVRAQGIDEIQGFYFSRPIPMHETLELLQTRGTRDAYAAGERGVEPAPPALMVATSKAKRRRTSS